jgi:hypothetical protein
MSLEKRKEARDCLREGSLLIDPRYLFPVAVYEEKLKKRCKECWHLREHFPGWVNEYIKRWSAEKASEGT